MINLLAQTKEIPLYPIDSYLQGFGPIGLETRRPDEAATLFGEFISTIIGLMTVIAFIWFVILLIIGAYGIMSSGGDKAAMETARKRLTSGVIGLVIVIAAIFIARLTADILGLNNILDVGEAIDLIGIPK